MKNLAYLCKSQREQELVCGLLEEMGCSYSKSLNYLEKNAKGFAADFESYPIVGLDSGGNITGWTNHGAVPLLTFSEFIKLAQESRSFIRINLNDEYEAVVSKSNVVVGCQTFTHDKVREIMAVIDRVTK
jgi:hypothetical protein